MPRHLRDIGRDHWLGEPYQSGGWWRCTLFRIVRGNGSGSTSWPIAEIDVLHHPGMDGVNPHKEVKISLRNDVRRTRSGIKVDKNKTWLRHIAKIVDRSVLDEAVTALKELKIVTAPCSLTILMRHVEDYRVEGEFWNDD